MSGLCHTHSEYSWDSPLKLQEAAGYVKDLGHIFYALTDHGTMSGLVEHEKACRAVGLKPGLGCEIYYQNSFNTEEKRTHLTIIARDNQGLENLYQIQSKAAENFYYVPVVTAEILEQHAKGLIILSGCLSSLSSRLLLDDKLHDWQMLVEGLNAIADKGCFFLELQPFPVLDENGADLQKSVNYRLVEAAKALHFPLVMTGDSHFIKPEDHAAYQVSLKIARDKADNIGDYSARYLQSVDDMWKSWEKQMFQTDKTNINHASMVNAFNDAIKNQDVIAEMCEATTFKKPQLPVLIDLKQSPVRELAERVANGLKAKNLWTKEYRDRAVFELERIREKGFASYILIVSDEFSWYQQNGVPATIRGSAAGAVVSFALGLTNVDPLKFIDTDGGTSGFDRFMGADREDYPDIDIDIPSENRDAAVKHFQEKFSGKTALVATFGRWQAKNLVNKLETAWPLQEKEALSLKNILRDMSADKRGLTQSDLLALTPFVELEKNNPGLADALCLLHGTVNYTGTHASAVAITKEPIITQLSLNSVAKNGGRVLQTCYDKDDLEVVGGVKVDFLGNDGLSAIKTAEEDAGVSFDESWLIDPDMLQGFITGDTAGINQFEKADATSMIKQIARALKGFRFEDLIAVNAINRPGAASVYDYTKGANELWSPLCQDSRGALIYQEQVIKLLRYAGFDWHNVTVFVKSNKKKIHAPDSLKTAFIAGLLREGNEKEKIIEAWDKIDSLYLFNKSHATSYALMAAEEMFLKNGLKPLKDNNKKAVKGPYTFSWFLGLLKHEGKIEKRRIYASDAVHHGVFLWPPHVNGRPYYRKIFVKQKGVETPYIQEGLLHLDSVGRATAYLIEEERLAHGDYTSEDDFIARFKAKRLNGEKFKSPASPGMLETLRKYGCLEFDLHKKAAQVLGYNRELAGRVVYIP